MASVSMASGLDGVGWILGHTIDGTQEDALLFADIFPTSYEVGVLNGRVAPGDTVVIVGAGPIDLAAIATCRLMSPLHIVVVDPAASRRGAARLAGASVTMGPDEDVQAVILGLTEELGTFCDMSTGRIRCVRPAADAGADHSPNRTGRDSGGLRHLFQAGGNGGPEGCDVWS